MTAQTSFFISFKDSRTLSVPIVFVCHVSIDLNKIFLLMPELLNEKQSQADVL